ncbi:MAG: helix-turn-helix domain-containing protein [Rhodobacteraceae bacterium]|nr:helix-turn-helix domain-containing protein [Paracoccaceae bacterium]
MGDAVAVYHGPFGRVAIYNLRDPMVTHAHREGHLTFYVDGPMSQMPVMDTPYDLNPETVVACSPWQPHSFQPGVLGTPSMFLVLYIKPIWYSEIARNPRPGLQFGTNFFYRTAKIAGYVNKLINLLFLNEETDLIDGYLYELTQECYDESWKQAEALERSIKLIAVSDFRVRRAIQLMREGIGETMILDGIARESGLSRPHFFKLFKQQTGLTPNLYLNTLRVETALSDLSDQSKTVNSIAEHLGFSSQASFSRFFSSNVGLAPSHYRRVASFI